MTLTLPNADIRGFYVALGISLPEWSSGNAAVVCFASSGEHHHGDRHPSASVDLISGAWLCHGCGAHGGAYDAALTQGHTPRSAIDLMIAHGLTERRSGLRTARELVAHPAFSGSVKPRAARAALRATEEDVARWQQTLIRRPNVAIQLAHERRWSHHTMHELGLGLDRGRITIPIRDQQQRLIGVLRYQPTHSDRPKMLAVPGTQLGPIPHPAIKPSPHVVIVEGPPDMIAGRSAGLPTIAIPGDHAWQAGWARQFSDRQVTIIVHSDAQGRAAGERCAGHDV
jgi:hypothetical protein